MSGMWWWKRKVDAVVWIGASRVEVGNGKKAWNWQMDGKLVKNLEVVDRAKLIQSWEAMGVKSNLRGRRVAVVMGAETCFVKKTNRTELDAFWDEVPFPGDQIAKLTIGGKGNELTAVATNKELFVCAYEGLTKCGAKVVAVVPGGNGGTEEAKRWFEVDDWNKIAGFEV